MPSEAESSTGVLAELSAAEVGWRPRSRGGAALAFYRRHRVALEWGVILAVLAIDGIALQALGFELRLRPHTAEMIAWGVLLIGILAARRWHLLRLQAICIGFLRLLLFLVAVGVLQYLAAVVPPGSGDAALAAIDQRLGFDWPALYGWTMAHPLVAEASDKIYNAFGWEIPFVILMLGVSEPERIAEYVTALAVALLLTVPFLCLLPVAGPFVFYGHTDIPQAAYTDHYLALRSGALRTIDLSDLRGIVSFPSFHTSGALLCALAMARHPLVFWPMLAFNTLVMAATPIMGGHYLVDVIGGIGVAGATAIMVRHLYNPPRALRGEFGDRVV
jgi:membrane-associated phospholipid phosphatase